MGSQLFAMDSRDASAVATANKVLPYLPDSIKAAAASLPIPAAAVMTVMSSIWIYKRKTTIKNSLHAFSELFGKGVPATVVAKRVSLNLCLQSESKLNQLAKDAQDEAQTKSFPRLREKLGQVKTFAQKRGLLVYEQDQSPMALQALDDLQTMQKALVELLGSDPMGYEALRQAGEDDKAAYLLQVLHCELIMNLATDTDAEAPHLIAHANVNANANAWGGIGQDSAANARVTQNAESVSLATHEQLRHQVAKQGRQIEDQNRQLNEFIEWKRTAEPLLASRTSSGSSMIGGSGRVQLQLPAPRPGNAARIEQNDVGALRDQVQIISETTGYLVSQAADANELVAEIDERVMALEAAARRRLRGRCCIVS